MNVFNLVLRFSPAGCSDVIGCLLRRARIHGDVAPPAGGCRGDAGRGTRLPEESTAQHRRGDGRRPRHRTRSVQLSK